MAVIYHHILTLEKLGATVTYHDIGYCFIKQAPFVNVLKLFSFIIFDGKLFCSVVSQCVCHCQSLPPQNLHVSLKPTRVEPPYGQVLSLACKLNDSSSSSSININTSNTNNTNNCNNSSSSNNNKKLRKDVDCLFSWFFVSLKINQ